MDFGEIIWFTVGWFVGGFVNGVTGIGAGMAAMPFVLEGMDISLAVPACSIMVLIVSLEQVWRYHDFTDWARMRPLVIGALPGALAGVLALRFLPPVYLKTALGIFLLCYAAWGLFLEGASRTVISGSWGYVAGFFSTTFGTAFSFNGPPLAVYATLAGWNKDTSKAGLAAFFAVTCVLIISSQAIAGLHSTHTIALSLLGTPGSVFGAWLGFKISRGLGDTLYRNILFAFIGITGASFLWQTTGAIFR